MKSIYDWKIQYFWNIISENMNNSQQFFTDNELSAKFYPIISSKYPNFDKMEEFDFRQIQ